MRIRGLSSAPLLAIAAGGLVVGLAMPAAAHETKHLISGSSIKKHSISANRIKDHSLGAAQLTPLTWHRITHFDNDWQDGSIGSKGYRSPAYAVDAQGIVHLRGELAGGLPGNPAFVLPKADLPKPGVFVYVPILASGGIGASLQVTSHGIAPQPGTANDAEVTDLSGLDGVEFAPR